MKVIIIDALNMFLRSYVVVPSMDSKGRPFGGCIGFMKSLQKLCREIKPDEIVVCWDGVGGSEKKKKLKKDYKSGRKPLRFNRRMIELPPEEQEKNKAYQQLRLYTYLNEMPIIQISIDGVEADDVIAKVARHKRYRKWEKIIVSSDKDFFQLCSKSTVVYRPIQNVTMTVEKLIEMDKIHPNNYALARALVGDPSDNLPGIRGIGMKTVAKYFSILKEEAPQETYDIIKLCEEVERPTKCHERILAEQKKFELNFDMMQLYRPMLTNRNIDTINYSVESFEPELNKFNILKLLSEDGKAALNLNTLYNCLRKIKR